MKFSQLLLGLLFLFPVKSLLATTGSDSTKVQLLDEVVVTAQYAPQRAEQSLYKLQIIPATELRARAANTLSELLYQELDIRLEQRSVFGASPEIQGMSKENVKILIDGVPVVGRINGILDLSQIQLDGIARVEIVEGPTSVFYGTDAMAGTINLITDRRQTKPFQASVSTHAESVGAYKFSASLGYMKGNSRLSATGGTYLFSGLSANENTTEDSRALLWEPRQQRYGSLQYLHWFGDLRLNYSGRLFFETLTKLGEADTTHTAKDIYYHTRRIDNSLNLSGPVAEQAKLDVTAAYMDYYRFSNSFFTNVESGEQTLSPVATDHDTTRYDLAFFKAQLSGEKAQWAYMLGSEVNLESSEGRRILDGRQSIRSYAAFAGLRFTLWKQLYLQPGLRYTYNDTYGDLFSPAFNLKWDLGENNRLLASYARGFRAPSLKELYLDFTFAAGPFTYHITGNTGLQAEKSHNFNLSFFSRVPLGGERALIFEPALYYNDINNLIALSALVDYSRSYINVNRHKTKGGRFDLTYLSGERFLAKAGIALTGRYNAFVETAPENLPDFLYTVDFNSRIRYRLSKQDLSLSLYYRYTGKTLAYAVEKGTGDLIETLIEPHGILDFTANKSFFNRQLNVDAGVKNILNLRNLDVVRTQTGEAHASNAFLWGRTYFLRLKWKF